MATTAAPRLPGRDILVFAILAVIIVGVYAAQGSVYSTRVFVEAGCYAILALGLNIQWGYAGLFNVGIMGFIAAGAATSMIATFPSNPAFWASDGPVLIVGFIIRLALGVLLIVFANLSHHVGAGPRLKPLLIAIAIAAAWIMVTTHVEPMAREIEGKATWIGGFGLPVFAGWLLAAVVAGLIAWFVGKVCLGLRADYLAIATLGFAQIIKTFLKNADWLTKGTLTVSPLPWPVPRPEAGEFLLSRALYLSLVAVLIVLIYLALERAYRAPWGRMMRAIRDNEEAAEAMGKDVNRRRLEIFVFGCMLMGLGGAMLIHFASVFDPAGFIDLNHTFLVWVMVILGGSGNNRGAIFGALLVYIIWTMSAPVASWLFDQIRTYGDAWFGWQAPADLDSRALQMRVFVIGLTITLVLRLAPRGVLPEEIPHKQ
ncbi:MAG: branched-chain amino acid ABC transporter permease [Alphaproteobacteria bacterium]|nr:MAG: branched-chain amino acid ABC transporter permease [Alphaproteobacteria bacterium]